MKSKIDSCSQTYNNFTLLYLQAEICLIKRLIEPNSPLNESISSINDSFMNNKSIKATSLSDNSINNNKKSFGDKILDLFRRPTVIKQQPEVVDKNNEIQILSGFKTKY